MFTPQNKESAQLLQQLDASERSKFLIFRPAFYRWLEEMLGTPVIRI